MAIPVIDRHMHLEGSLDPAWVRERAAREGVAIPATLESLWRREQVPFDGFIEAFLFSCRFLNSAEAAREILHAAAKRLPQADKGEEPAMRGLDIWVSPHNLCNMLELLSLEDLWKGMDQGIADLKKQNIHVAVIIDAVNHFGVDHGHEVLDLVLEDKPDWVVGFSTGGLEGVPFRDWAKVFERARKAGLRLAAHAGENGPGTNVRDAILEAGVSRIVHGVRASAHPEILELLAERLIPVDICITSNRALVHDFDEHPLPAMLRAGVRCALGLDDPGVIPCDMAGEWGEACALGLNPSELNLLRKHAVEDAWCMAM